MANRGKTLNTEVFCIDDIKQKASQNLPREYKEFFNEGAMDLITVDDNEKAYDRYKIRPRILKDVSNLDTSTTVCGQKVSFPFGFSPAAMHKLAHPDGEVGVSRAAASANIPMALSTYATTRLEDVVAQGTGNPYFMQTSILKNRDITADILQRAEKSGYKAALLTIDIPRLGQRLNEYRNNFSMPEGLSYPNLDSVMKGSSLADTGGDLAYEDALTWPDAVAWMRKITNMELWLKGVYTAEDVELAIQYGVDGILISNHGGRQLDGVPATLDALGEIAPVAKGKIALAVDGGIRRGTDIFKALALGADFCFTGRVPIWGLAYNGEEGVKLAVDFLRHEFEMAMALAGCKTIKDINKSRLSILDKGVLCRL